MRTFKVIRPENTYEIIEADYFTVVHRPDGVSYAEFYVNKVHQDFGGTVTEGILIGYARNPEFIETVRTLDSEKSGL